MRQLSSYCSPNITHYQYQYQFQFRFILILSFAIAIADTMSDSHLFSVVVARRVSSLSSVEIIWCESSDLSRLIRIISISRSHLNDIQITHIYEEPPMQQAIAFILAISIWLTSQMLHLSAPDTGACKNKSSLADDLYLTRARVDTWFYRYYHSLRFVVSASQPQPILRGSMQLVPVFGHIFGQ